MNSATQSRFVFGVAAALAGCAALAQQPQTTPAKDTVSSPVVAAQGPAISAEAKAVLDRAVAAYHGYQTFQQRTEIVTGFDYSGPNDSKYHQGQTNYLLFRYTAKPWRFAFKGSTGCIYGDEKRFATLNYGQPDKSGAYEPDREQAKTEYTDEGTIDWGDLAGSSGRGLGPDPVACMYMGGPKAALDLFRRATEVQPGEVDGQAGVWIRGKGPCPYTYGSGGVEITPISAWFNAGTGRLGEIHYDISNCIWAQSALEPFAKKNGEPSTMKAAVVIRYSGTAADAPIDEKLITDNKESPVEFMQTTPGETAKPAGSKVLGTGEVASMPAVRMGTGMPMVKGGPGKTPVAAAGENKDAPPAPEVEHAPAAIKRLMNQPAPIFAGKSPDGVDLKLSDLKGKVVLMDFWATWCGPCMQAIPKVQQLHEKFKDQGVAIVGINRDRPSDDVNKKVKKVLERKEITFSQVMDQEGVIVKAFKVTALPTMIVIDKEGVVRAIHIGYGPDEAEVLADEISKLLKGEKLAASKE